MNDEDFEKALQKSKDRVARLRAKYPLLYSKLEYIDINEGWMDLVDHMSAVIHNHIQGHVPVELRDQIYFEQIKQKFGGLRVHVSHWVPFVQGAIAMAEDMSFKVCEVCGDGNAKRRNIRNWYTALCDTHAKEAEEKGVERY